MMTIYWLKKLVSYFEIYFYTAQKLFLGEISQKLYISYFFIGIVNTILVFYLF